MHGFVILLILIVPLIAAVAVYLPVSRYWPAWLTIVSSTLNFALVLKLAGRLCLSNSDKIISAFGLHKIFFVDAFSALILILVAFVSTTAAIFSLGYMRIRGFAYSRIRPYYLFYNLFVFSMLAVPVLADPALVWIAVELTTLCSVLLVSFENTRQSLEAAWKYVVLTLMGAGIALFGFMFLFAAMKSSGSSVVYTWEGLEACAHLMNPVFLQVSFLFIFIGLGVKVGLVPMHTWLPDAHSQAPSPVCALLSGIETTVVLYVILRMFPIMRFVPNAHAQVYALVFGLLSAGVAAFLLLQVQDFKRMFAFSTVEHMGIILVAAGFGMSASGYAVMLQILSHSVTKTFCFLTAGAVLLLEGSRHIPSIKGIIRKSPLTGVFVVLAGLGIAGAPPFALFLSEVQVMKAGFDKGRYAIVAVLALFIVIAFFGIMYHINRMVFSGGGDFSHSKLQDTQNQKACLPFSCWLALVLLAVPMVVLGLYIPNSLRSLLLKAAAALTG